MKSLIIPFALSFALFSGAAFASSDNQPLDDAKRAEITTKLTEEGYDVRKIEMEDGDIEVYALKDGKKLELYLAPDLTITRTKTSD